jgi:hypothetical protein
MRNRKLDKYGQVLNNYSLEEEKRHHNFFPDLE